MFLELNSEAIEAEVDEYTRELYKIQKVFAAKVKKMQIEWDERDRERKKKRRMAEEDGEAVHEEEAEELQIPQAVGVCNTVMETMQEFKVSGKSSEISLSPQAAGVLNKVLEKGDSLYLDIYKQSPIISLFVILPTLPLTTLKDRTDFP